MSRLISRTRGRRLCRIGATTLTGLAAAGWVAADARPLNVAVRLSPERAVTATIGPNGGKLRTKSAQGTRFELAIPARALAANLEITMTPVKSIGRYPFKRRAAGAIQLEPAGLLLERAARLTIVPRRKVPLKLQAAFAFGRAGRDFHLFPPAPNRRKLVLPLTHFSGYGEGAATPRETARLAHRRPADGQARAEAGLAGVLNRARREGKDPQDESLQEPLARAILPIIEDVAERLKRAEASDSGLTETIEYALDWDRQLNLLGLEGERYENVWWPLPKLPVSKPRNPSIEALRRNLRRAQEAAGQSLFWRVFENAHRRAKKQCVDNHDPSQATRMLIIAEWVSKLSGPDFTTRAIADAAACLRFRLEITSDSELTFSGGDAYAHRIETTIELTTSNSVPSFTEGTGTDSVTSASITTDPESFRTYAFSGQRSAEAWAHLLINDNVKRDKGRLTLDQERRPATVKALDLRPGDPQAIFQCTATDPFDPGNVQDCGVHEWGHNQSVWIHNHFDEFQPGSDPMTFKIEECVPGTGEVFATKAYASSVDVGPFWVHEQSTRLTLRHVPVQ